jgi:hypothetical protein
MHMGDYRPLSKQGIHDVDLDSLHLGLEPWMVRTALSWLAPFLWRSAYRGNGQNDVFLHGLEITLRLRDSLNWGGEQTAAWDVEDRLARSPSFGMDVLGYAVSNHHLAHGGAPDFSFLNSFFEMSGSAWQVTQQGNDTFLSRRDLEAAKHAIRQVEPLAERPAHFLTAAWMKVATRDPDPNGAYDNAIKAVEAAAHSVVSPSNAKATLGTMIRDLKAKPAKWTFALGDVGTVIAMADTLWTNHFRHGTQEREDHTLSEADAAVHLAIPLVRYFAGGLLAVARHP